ncbi:hypothetical protein ACOME3_000419 [Neoechinorhynchus agilis]
MDNSMEMKAMEDHKTWRRNARYLYDLLIDQASEWPMMSLEFLPDISRPEGKDYSTQRLLVGINGDNEDTKSYLEIIGVRVPNRNRSFTSIDFNQELREYGGFVKDPTRSYLAPSIRILYNGDVHRTRHLPQNPSVIAAKGSTNSVYIFDYTRHTSLPTASDEFKYEIELVGHIDKRN